jgi:hypothetical protein
MAHISLDPPPLGFDGCLTKILFTFLGIFVCMLTRSVPLGVRGLDFIPTIVRAGVVINGALVTITIDGNSNIVVM